jgi:hypothetical protein
LRSSSSSSSSLGVEGDKRRAFYFNGQAFDVGAEIEDSVGVDAEAGELIGEF